MRHSIRSWRAVFVGSIAVGTVFSLAGLGLAGTHSGTRSGLHGAASRQQALNAYLHAHSSSAPTANHTPNDGDLADQFAQWNAERTAPAGFVSGQALVTGAQQAALLPTTPGTWQEFTNQPYNAQPSTYTDPFWGNQGAGWSLVGGRTTALATAPDGTWFAGTADGGVWRSTDQGQNWTPVFDSMPTLSIGALAVNPVDGSLWVGTGDANVSQDSYAGTGVYRSTDDGQTWQRVGDDSSGNNPLVSHTGCRLSFDLSGSAYAAADNGLVRFAAGRSSGPEIRAAPRATGDPP